MIRRGEANSINSHLAGAAANVTAVKNSINLLANLCDEAKLTIAFRQLTRH